MGECPLSKAKPRERAYEDEVLVDRTLICGLRNASGRGFKSGISSPPS